MQWKTFCYSLRARKSNQEKKQRTNTKYHAMKIESDIFMKSNREKSNIAITIFENEPLNSTIIYSVVAEYPLSDREVLDSNPPESE